MSEDTREQQGAASLEAKNVRVYLPPSWLTRRFVVLALIGLLTVGPLPSVVIITGADQFIRNKIDNWMSDPDLYNSLTLGPDEYARLPVHWRQALAEIAVRDEAEAAAVQELIKTLKPEDIMLVNRLAPYETNGFIIRDSEYSSQHPIPTLSLVDFARLEDLGILQTVQQGFDITYDLGSSPSHQSYIVGTTVALVMLGSQQGETSNHTVYGSWPKPDTPPPDSV